jgi:hypothetical protein
VPRARRELVRGAVWGAVLCASLMAPSPMIAAVAAVDSGAEPMRVVRAESRALSAPALDTHRHQGPSPDWFGGTTLVRVIDHHGAVHPVVGDRRLAGCRWWEAWCKAPVQRCAKTGSQWAIVGAIGAGVAGVWTGPTVAVAAGAGGVGGAISGCVAGIFRW